MRVSYTLVYTGVHFAEAQRRIVPACYPIVTCVADYSKLGMRKLKYYAQEWILCSELFIVVVVLTACVWYMYQCVVIVVAATRC